jgi:hypothetical protein
MAGRRRLLVLCAYGAYNYFTRVGADELELMHDQAERHGGQVGGLPLEALIERAEYRRAALAEQLPPLAPDDLLLVGSPAVFDELEDKLRSVGSKMAKDRWKDDMPERYRATSTHGQARRRSPAGQGSSSSAS